MRRIQKVAVLGSGVMGSRIACHFANIGCQVVLLDIVPFDLTEEQKSNKAARNRIVDGALKSTMKSRPGAIFHKDFVSRIVTGNFDDNMNLIADCDWVIEAVIENLEIKKQVFSNVEEHRKAGSIISSNTSSIPMAQMCEDRSEDFQTCFVGTHFFNPPRYLELLEIVPGPSTDQGIIDFLMDYGQRFLGKTTVFCKDTTGFIANRIGVFGIQAVFHAMAEQGLTIEEVDALTGPALGRPKSATFRTSDVVGIDTMVKVATSIYNNAVDDEQRDMFKIPDFVNKLVEKGWLGDKTKGGFYKKTKTPEGKREILTLDIESLEYRAKQKARFSVMEQAKMEDDLMKKIKIMHTGEGKAQDFLRAVSCSVFQYVSNRIPEIADEVYKVDDAMKGGFRWDVGPFESWDAMGVQETVDMMEAVGKKPAQWVYEMLASGATTFYQTNNGVKQYWDIPAAGYKTIPGTESLIILENLKGQSPVWGNAGTTIRDIGDGILNLEFHTKMNAIGEEIINGIHKAIDLAEEGYRGLVIANEAENFSAGANLMMILMLANEQEWDELDMAVRQFQNTCMRLRYSSIPVVACPHGLTLGGGCEITMHADKVVASAETYIGLVEVGAGLIPAGGGTKEFVLRVSDGLAKGDPYTNRMQESFVNIATAKVATSAHEAIDMGILKKDKDVVVLHKNHVIVEAKQQAITMADHGYTQPIQREDIQVGGRSILAGMYSGTYGFHFGNYASEHDMLIGNKLGYVMSGGDLSGPAKVSEQYLLDLEREAFLSLLGEQKSLERMQHILTTGKPLRN